MDSQGQALSPLRRPALPHEIIMINSKINAGIIAVAACILLAGAVLLSQRPFTRWERTIINESADVMYVTVLPQDSAVLRTPSVDFTLRELHSKELKTLMAKMLSTVTDPSQDGVGIAAPQVGINKRLVWVQRLDKEGEPFECYLNIRIDSLIGEKNPGPEGCLSVPGMRGIVPRYESAVISYVNPETFEQQKETINGFTAVIFQHECDHLDGILYIDKADSVFRDEKWTEELRQFSYEKPGWWKD